MSSGKKVALPFAVVPSMLGSVLLLTGTILLYFAFRMDSEATGTINRIDQGSTSGGSARCSLSAVFEVSGQTYVAASLDASPSNCKLRVGDSIVVDYDSANPASARIRLNYLTPLGAGLTAGGLLLCLVGWLSFRRNARGKARRQV